MTAGPAAPSPGEWSFHYRGHDFLCSVTSPVPGAFLPHVLYRGGLPGTEQVALPVDTDAYGSLEEARRHAEQQATRWVHDRLGGGQGRF